MDRERFLGELTVDVALGPSCATLVSAVALDDVGNLPIEIFPFGIRKEFLVGVLGGTLQRDIDISRPDALKIRLAPGRLQLRFAAVAEGSPVTKIANDATTIVVSTPASRSRRPFLLMERGS